MNMIRDRYKKFFLNIENIYFAEELVQSNADIVSYSQCKEAGPLNAEFTSPIIDLTKDIAEIDRNFRKSLRNEIKDANNNYNIVTDFELNVSDELMKNFNTFYSFFSAKKSIEAANFSKLERLKRNIIISYAKHNGSCVAWHLYLSDTKKIRLLYSATKLSEKKDELRLIVRANKLLHLNDIVAAKEEGFLEYDLGGVGIGVKNLEGINKFKLGFTKNIAVTNNFIIANSLLGKICLWLSQIARRS
mgnify:CR=1 FL=1